MGETKRNPQTCVSEAWTRAPHHLEREREVRLALLEPLLAEPRAGVRAAVQRLDVARRAPHAQRGGRGGGRLAVATELDAACAQVSFRLSDNREVRGPRGSVVSTNMSTLFWWSTLAF